MFKLTKEQIRIFDSIARAKFHERLAAYLREVMPEEANEYSDDALIGYIAASAGRASKHGIETEAGIAQWTCLSLVAGVDFDDDPLVQEYFRAPGMDQEEKLESLVDGLNEALLDGLEAGD